MQSQVEIVADTCGDGHREREAPEPHTREYAEEEHTGQEHTQHSRGGKPPRLGGLRLLHAAEQARANDRSVDIFYLLCSCYISRRIFATPVAPMLRDTLGERESEIESLRWVGGRRRSGLAGAGPRGPALGSKTADRNHPSKD